MTSNTPNNKRIIPFWRPWGPMGCLWRTIVFLLGILLLCFLFSLLKQCNRETNKGNLSEYSDQFMETPLPGSEEGYTPPAPLPLPDSIPSYDNREEAPIVDDWNETIPGVDELPKPEDNFIPPVDDSRIVEDPEDPYAQVLAGQIAVFFNSNDLNSDMASFAKQFKQNYPDANYQIAYYNPIIGSMILAVPDDKVYSVLDELPNKITGVDFKLTTPEIMGEKYKPTEPMFKHPMVNEYFDLIQAYDAWDITKGNPDIKVAVVDSYFDISNPEIGTRYVDPIHIPSKTRAIMPPSTVPTNDYEFGLSMHGSHVAGIAVGAQDNGLGVSGIAPGCTLIPVSLGGEMTDFNVIEGILYAIYKGADVVNISLGRSFPEGLHKVLPVEDQVEYSKQRAKRSEEVWNYVAQVAMDHNCVLVVAAGNDTLMMGMDPMNRPNNMIKVEAVDGNGKVTSFSNYGDLPKDQIDYSTVSAPGHAIWSVMPRQSIPFANKVGIPSTADGFGLSQGTSMAAPIVTGAVALLKSVNKDLTGEEIIKILVETAKPVAEADHIGPVIQIADALKKAQSMKKELPRGSGEMMNYDDVQRDHNLLVGKWKSTYELNLRHEKTGETEPIWTYFIFTSPTSGRIEHHSTQSGNVYTAPLSVTWGNNDIRIQQLSEATSPGETPITAYTYRCRPNANRLLETDVIENGNKNFDFLLEKIK